MTVLSVRRLYTIMLLAGAGGFVWLGYVFFNRPAAVMGACLIKGVTGVPCPSCGTTRAIEALLRGRFMDSLLLNPFGIVVLSVMIVFPLWIAADLVLGRQSFYEFYGKTEAVLKRKYVAIPLAILVLFNWIWNIAKGL